MVSVGQDDEDVPMKVCASCRASKPHSEFNNQAAAKDGLRWNCKACVRERRGKRVGKQHKKRCRACDKTKPARYFYTDRTKPDGVSDRCKRCCNEARWVRYANAVNEDNVVSYDFETQLVEHEIGTPGWKRMIESEKKRTEDAFERMRSNREEVMGR